MKKKSRLTNKLIVWHAVIGSILVLVMVTIAPAMLEM